MNGSNAIEKYALWTIEYIVVLGDTIDLWFFGHPDIPAILLYSTNKASPKKG